MDIDPFGLERWFADHEAGADLMLGESGVRSLPADRFDTDPGDLGYVVPTNGDPALRERVGARHDRDADEVLFTCGTQEANFLALFALSGPDTHAVVVTPTYQSLATLPATFGDVTRVELSPPTWRLDVDAVAEAVRPETTLVVLANPNNPTGRYHGDETVAALADVAADAGARLLCDEVYRPLAADPLPPVASMAAHGVSTGGLSKAYGLAGLRFGWLVGDAELIERAWRLKDYTTISPPAFAQHVARQALGRRESTILGEAHELVAHNHDRVADFVERYDLSWYPPTAGVVAFPTVPDPFPDGETFCRRVVDEASVVLVPGECFGHPDRFRLGFGSETETLVEGLERVGRVIERAR